MTTVTKKIIWIRLEPATIRKLDAIRKAEHRTRVNLIESIVTEYAKTYVAKPEGDRS